MRLWIWAGNVSLVGTRVMLAIAFNILTYISTYIIVDSPIVSLR